MPRTGGGVDGLLRGSVVGASPPPGDPAVATVTADRRVRRPV